jgi:hypothetical protein
MTGMNVGYNERSESAGEWMKMVLNGRQKQRESRQQKLSMQQLNSRSEWTVFQLACRHKTTSNLKFQGVSDVSSKDKGSKVGLDVEPNPNGKAKARKFKDQTAGWGSSTTM